jgi:hypothetical protein
MNYSTEWLALALGLSNEKPFVRLTPDRGADMCDFATLAREMRAISG